MRFLFDSRGDHIANEVDGHLHTPSGANIGHYLPDEGIFIDMRGRYLGEIIHENRLMSDLNSPHRSVNYGIHGNYGNVGSYGSPGNCGNVGGVPGYEDISSDRLE